MSDIEKNFMTRFDSLVARHRNEIENEATKEIAVTESPPVSLSLKSVEEEQERIMRKVYGNTSDHVNYNQNIKNMREDNVKLAVALGNLASPGNDSKRASSATSTPKRTAPIVPRVDPRDHQIKVLRETLTTERKESARALERAFEREMFLKKQVDALRTSDSPSLMGVGEVEEALDRMRESSRIAIESAQKRALKAENEVALMKKSLIEAKAYQLHTTMEKLILDSSRAEKKYKAMISNLQAEKIMYLEKISELEKKLYGD